MNISMRNLPIMGGALVLVGLGVWGASAAVRKIKNLSEEIIQLKGQIAWFNQHSTTPLNNKISEQNRIIHELKRANEALQKSEGARTEQRQTTTMSYEASARPDPSTVQLKESNQALTSALSAARLRNEQLEERVRELKQTNERLQLRLTERSQVTTASYGDSVGCAGSGAPTVAPPNSKEPPARVVTAASAPVPTQNPWDVELSPGTVPKAKIILASRFFKKKILQPSGPYDLECAQKIFSYDYYSDLERCFLRKKDDIISLFDWILLDNDNLNFFSFNEILAISFLVFRISSYKTSSEGLKTMFEQTEGVLEALEKIFRPIQFFEEFFTNMIKRIELNKRTERPSTRVSAGRFDTMFTDWWVVSKRGKPIRGENLSWREELAQIDPSAKV